MPTFFEKLDQRASRRLIHCFVLGWTPTRKTCRNKPAQPHTIFVCG